MEENDNIVCPRCGNPECLESDVFCFNCRSYLKNHCTNDLCVMNNGEQTELLDEMCYCPQCGEETLFMQQGYIQPKKFKEE